MKYVALTLALLLGGCAVHKPAATSTAPGSESIGADALPVDSTSARLPVGDREFVRVNPDTPDEAGLSRRLDSVVVEPHRTLLGKLLGRKPARYISGADVGNIGKKSAVSIYYGSATVTNTSAAKKSQVAAGPDAVLTNIEKPKAPTATGSGAAQDFTKQGQRGGAAASGADATATATTSKGFPWWLLLIPVVGYAAYRVNKRFTIF